MAASENRIQLINDDTAVKAAALDMYVSMDFPRITSICKKFKLERKVVDEWRESENWLAIRSQHRDNATQALITELGDPSTVPDRIIKIGQRLLGVIEKRAGNATTASDCVELSKVSEKVYDLLCRAYRQVGLMK